jgi:HD-GYP domain-containing protein (c-di-GMP phosphodiesterase class II)/ActR/RegA family two-component response regulator
MQFKDLLKSHSDVQRDAAQQAERPLPGKSVVIAEPERAACDLIAAQVVDLGYTPLTASNGQAALDLARRNLPRLVVANMALPGLVGVELLRALRAEPATRDIAVMLVSNTDKTPDMVAGSQVGCDDYLCKPLDGGKVRSRIRELLLKPATVPPTPFRPTAPIPPDEPAAKAKPSQDLFVAPVTAKDPIELADQLYTECLDFTQDAMARARNDEAPDITRCRELAARLVRECGRSNRLLLKAIRPYEAGERMHDAPNVAIFSIKIGAGLKYDPEEQAALAMAALCHEVGMGCVPSELAEVEGRYSKRQWNQIRQVPEHSRKLLLKLGDEYAWLAEAVYQSHERENGQGYPQGIAGEQITEFAKIIGLADTYESLTHPRTFRKAFIGFDAMREVIGMRGKFFASHIIRALVSEVSVFPLESYVQLNTGETARVVKTNADNLLRPTVVVEYDPSGQKLNRPKLVDLVARPLIYVTKPVDERELAHKG